MKAIIKFHLKANPLIGGQTEVIEASEDWIYNHCADLNKIFFKLYHHVHNIKNPQPQNLQGSPFQYPPPKPALGNTKRGNATALWGDIEQRPDRATTR